MEQGMEKGKRYTTRVGIGCKKVTSNKIKGIFSCNPVIPPYNSCSYPSWMSDLRRNAPRRVIRSTTRPKKPRQRGFPFSLKVFRQYIILQNFFVPRLTFHNDITKLFDMKNLGTQTSSIPPEWQPMARVFTALGDEHRQRILLLFEKGERLNVGQIAAVSTLARSTVSHHLKVLHESGVLGSEKIGKEVWFWIDRQWLEETLANVLAYVRQNC